MPVTRELTEVERFFAGHARRWRRGGLLPMPRGEGLSEAAGDRDVGRGLLLRLVCGRSGDRRVFAGAAAHAELVLQMVQRVLGASHCTLPGSMVWHSDAARVPLPGYESRPVWCRGSLWVRRCRLFRSLRLRAMAQGCHRHSGARHVLAALDARMDEVYWGAFEATPTAGVHGAGATSRSVRPRRCVRASAHTSGSVPAAAGLCMKSAARGGGWFDYAPRLGPRTLMRTTLCSLPHRSSSAGRRARGRRPTGVFAQQSRGSPGRHARGFTMRRSNAPG